MRVFLTGATGFIGTAIVPELISAGHQVLGLTRSDKGADALRAAGAEAHRGDLEQLDTLRSGAEQADAVIHTAFDHNFSDFNAICEKDRRAITALADSLVGSDRPLVITSGVGLGDAGPGELATEDRYAADHPNPRKASEEAGIAALDRGVNVSVVRLPQVHDPVKQGLITYLVQVAREKKVSAYLDEGRTRWAAAHVLDVARLYRLAMERHESGSRYNAVAEEGVPSRDIAEALARGLGVPACSIPQGELAAHFGWLGMFMGMDLAASSAITREKLHWNPTGPGLIADLDSMNYKA